MRVLEIKTTPKRNENKCPYKEVCINVHNIIPNNPRGKSTQISINWWTNIMEYCLAIKRSEVQMYAL